MSMIYEHLYTTVSLNMHIGIFQKLCCKIRTRFSRVPHKKIIYGRSTLQLDLLNRSILSLWIGR